MLFCSLSGILIEIKSDRSGTALSKSANDAIKQITDKGYAEELKKDGIKVEVVNVSVVKPLDTKTIVESAKKTDLVITVENHSVIGGLGTAVCEALSENYPVRVYRIGVNDEFGQSGKADELLNYYGLDAQSLVKRIKSIYKKEKGNK